MLSAIPGGIFAPSLAVGAGFGSTVGSLLVTRIALSAILGMAGYFSGVVQAPMTAFVIILEMTGDHQAVIPIMAVSMIVYVTSRILPASRFITVCRASSSPQPSGRGGCKGTARIHKGTSTPSLGTVPEGI